MAKIETITPPKNQKKRKLKDVHDARAAEAESPTSKFKKLDISQIGVKKKKNSVSEASSSNAATPKKKTKQSTSTDEIMVIEAPVQKEKAKKRKAETETTATSNKVTKVHVDDPEHDSADNPSYEPSVAELQLADDPENTPNIETTRQKKRTKHQKVVEAAKVDSALRESERNLFYLRMWKTDRMTWKFNKLRQISIQQSLFREKDVINDETWSLSLEYLSGTKGRGRDLLIEAAEKVINEIDERINAENQEELVNQVRYTRARELLQMFQ